MKISQIRAGMRGITIVGEVVSISSVREVMTRYGPAKLAVAIIRDDTGSIKLNLWRRQIDIVKVGDKIRVVNAFVKEFRGVLELNVGSDGKIEVLKHGLRKHDSK